MRLYSAIHCSTNRLDTVVLSVVVGKRGKSPCTCVFALGQGTRDKTSLLFIKTNISNVIVSNDVPKLLMSKSIAF